MAIRAVTEMPVAVFDISQAVNALRKRQEHSDELTYSMATLMRHVAAYMDCLSAGVPRVLSYLADITNWNRAKLQDPVTGEFRKPKVALWVTKDKNDTLEFWWQYAGTTKEPLPADMAKVRNAHDNGLFCTDYRRALKGDGPWNPNRIATLPLANYPEWADTPSGDLNRLSDGDYLRDAFNAFLNLLVTTFRCSLDVELGMWPNFDAQGKLYLSEPRERLGFLAQNQLARASGLVEQTEHRLAEKLEEISLPQHKFDQALELAQETGVDVTEAVQQLVGGKPDKTQVRACVQAHKNVRTANATHSTCLAIYRKCWSIDVGSFPDTAFADDL